MIRPPLQKRWVLKQLSAAMLGGMPPANGPVVGFGKWNFLLTAGPFCAQNQV